jgi:class 3 adenylate cyclase
MLYQIVGDSVVCVWGLRPGNDNAVPTILETAAELVRMTAQVAEDWQSQIDLIIEPKGLRLGLSKGSVMVIRRDNVYPGLLLFGNPINLASRLQSVAHPNQLVCSNAAFKDIEQAGLSGKFEPYLGESNEGCLEAKNFGPLKAWVLDLAKKQDDATTGDAHLQRQTL